MALSITGLRQVAQYAEDLDRAVAFYRDVLGLTLIARYDPPGLAFFDLGATRLLLEGGAPSAVVYLHVDDVRRTCTELTARGVEMEGEPHIVFDDEAGTFGPAGQAEWLAFFRDSENNVVGLMSRN
jgi:methylmalonyl-CoA/ethylmalonyl-CoA epimerase